MSKKEKFVKIHDLSVSNILLSFVNKELLPGTKISKDHFWKGFNKSIHDLAKKNKEVVAIKLHVHTNNRSAIKAYEKAGMKKTPEYPYIFNLK